MAKRTTRKSAATFRTTSTPEATSHKDDAALATTPASLSDSSGVAVFPDEEIPIPKALEAWESIRPIVEAIPESALLPLRCSATEATERGLWMLYNANRDWPLFEATYKSPPFDAIKALKIAAFAVKGAEQAATPPSRILTTAQLKQFRDLRERICSIVRAVFFGHTEVQAELDRIETGRGHQDLGNDLLDLAKLISTPDHWKKLVNTGLVTNTDVIDLENAGAAVLEWTGSRPKGKRKKKTTPPPRILEQRAWTHLAEIYNLIRDHAYVIHRNDLAAWERDYPNLRAFAWSTKPAAATPNTGSNATDGQTTTPSSGSNAADGQTTTLPPPANNSGKAS